MQKNKNKNDKYILFENKYFDDPSHRGLDLTGTGLPPPPHTLIGASGFGLRAESCFSLIGKFVCSYLMCITDILCLVFYFIGAYMCPIPAGREIAEV